MSQEATTRFGCDNCKREVFSVEAPIGWSSLTLVTTQSTVFDTSDVCDSCSDAFIRTMTKRQQIEGGRHRERKLPVHNAPSPHNAHINLFAKDRVDSEEKSE